VPKQTKVDLRKPASGYWILLLIASLSF